MARTILVPLDATLESATVLDTVRELAHSWGATVRLLHVAPPPEAVVNSEGQTIAYADQETERAEHAVTVFLKSLLERLSGVRTELAVRFGGTVEEIVREAESADVELIAMTTHRRKGATRLIAGSVAETVERQTTRPVLLVGYAPRGRREQGRRVSPPSRERKSEVYLKR
jgi:nucleotide-binding universal stress UspA family protein